MGSEGLWNQEEKKKKKPKTWIYRPALPPITLNKSPTFPICLLFVSFLSFSAFFWIGCFYDYILLLFIISFDFSGCFR